MIGRAAGAPVVIEPSTLVGALVLAAVFYPGQAGLGSAALLVAVGFVVFLFASVLFHELAHGLTGRALGYRPRAFTLTLWGGHTRFETDMRTPGPAALVALAGPVVNLLLGAAFHSLWTVTSGPVTAWMLSYAAWINLVLGVFNLLPGLPLDGGHVLEALVWKVAGRRTTGTVVAAWIGRVVAVGVVVVMLGLPYLHGSRPTLVGALWVMIIAWTLWSGATGALRYVRHTEVLSTLTPVAVGHKAVGVVADSTLAQADLACRTTGAVLVAVLGDHGEPVALVDTRAVASVPWEQYALTPVTAVTIPVAEGAVVDAGADGAELVAVFQRTHAQLLVVTSGGRVVGVVTVHDVNEALKA